MSETINQRIEEAAKVLRDAESVACAGHVAPDGDALGSALGLAAAARLAGKNVSVAFGDPSVLADNLNFLPLDLISPVAEFPSEPEVMVAFDTASAERLGSLEAPARKAKTLIVVDHHVSNEGFGDIQIIDATAAASAELAYLLISAAGWPIDDAAATSLYTGLVTDTGRFQYSATSPRTLRIAAHLIEAGVRPEVIGQNLYEKVPFGYLALSARVLGRSQLDKARSMVWSSMTKEDLRATGLGYEDADQLIDDLRLAREADVALLIKQVAGGFKCSMRSRGATDVGAIAVALGGGGHHNASGFTHSGPVEAVMQAVSALIDG